MIFVCDFVVHGPKLKTLFRLRGDMLADTFIKLLSYKGAASRSLRVAS